MLYFPSKSTAFRSIGSGDLPTPLPGVLFEPRGYLPSQHLVDAVNVALLLGQPLLVTGEPGSGKTMLAYSIAYELGLDPPLRFNVKSTTTAKDLFYTYDALVHLRDVRGRLHKVGCPEIRALCTSVGVGSGFKDGGSPADPAGA